MSRPFRILFVVLVCIHTAWQQHTVEAEDSIPSQTLKEVSVKGERAWIEDGVVNYIPTKQEKRLSNSPATLVESMHMPMLRGQDGIITNLSGDEVPVFINGKPAGSIDLSTFSALDVKRLQYIENPKSPEYLGYPCVVNIVMAVYEFGGVARGDVSQRMPNGGDCTAASKLAYKKMTYGVRAAALYSNDHTHRTETSSVYRDLYYGGEHYSGITRQENSGGVSRSRYADLALNARYSTKGFRATHTLSLVYKRDPGSGTEATDKWSEDLFGSDASSSRTSSRSFTPSLSGDYLKTLSDKWYLSWKWQLVHAHSDNSSSSTTGLTPAVENRITEDVTSLNLSVQPMFYPSETLSFRLKTQASLDWFKSVYAGSTNASPRQSRQEASVSLDTYWQLLRNIGVRLETGGLYTSNWTGGVSRGRLYPILSAAAYWDPNTRLSVYGSVLFREEATSASEANPVLVRNSELMWTRGNPYLGNPTEFSASANTVWLAGANISAALRLFYSRLDKSVVHTYTAASAEDGGLIRELANSSPTDSYTVSLSLNGKFLGRRLSVDVRPKWRHTVARGAFAGKLSRLSISAAADYTFGNFRAGVSYDSPVRSLTFGGMQRLYRTDRTDLTLTYGSDNLYISLQAADILHRRMKSRIEYVSPHYDYVSHGYDIGRRLYVTVTYTIGYGRRIDRSIDIESGVTGKSSILNISE